jgi:hypothetical protein
LKGRYARRELFKAEYQHRKNWVQLTKGFIPLIVVCGNLFGQGEGQVSSEMNQHELG